MELGVPEKICAYTRLSLIVEREIKSKYSYYTKESDY